MTTLSVTGTRRAFTLDDAPKVKEWVDAIEAHKDRLTPSEAALYHLTVASLALEVETTTRVPKELMRDRKVAARRGPSGDAQVALIDDKVSMLGAVVDPSHELNKAWPANVLYLLATVVGLREQVAEQDAEVESLTALLEDR